MVPAGRHIAGTAKSPVRWATCSSAGGLFQEMALCCGAPSRGTTNQHLNTKPPVNKAPGRVPATPEQVCEMPPCEMPCTGLGRNYFRRVIQRPCLLPMQTTLETTTVRPGCLQVQFGCVSTPHQTSLLETRQQPDPTAEALSSAIHKRASAPAVGATNRDPAA